MLVAFRADASVQIGTGHVMRCLTLAEELARLGHHCLFVCRDHEGHLGDLIRRRGFELCVLSDGAGLRSESGGSDSSPYSDWLGVTWEKDSQETQEVLSGRCATWIVIDHYALDARWEREIAKHSGQIMVIDDLADREHDCAVLLDQNLGRAHTDYDAWVPPHTQRLIGPRYSLLRPEFRELRERFLKRRQAMECGRILISLGGVDRTNVTGRVLSALEASSLASSTKLDIVMGSSAPALEDIRSDAANSRFDATVNVNVTNMAERMGLADLSIGAAGSTSWERCCLGLPSIMVILAENQRLIGEALANAECALLIEESEIPEALPPMLDKLLETEGALERFASNAASVCDGNGASRVAAIMTGRDLH